MVRIACALAAILLRTTAVQAKLEINNIQAAYGLFGPERPTLDIYPGDDVFIRFTVSGAKVDAEGRVDTLLEMKLVDSNGDILLVQDNPMKIGLSLGGNTFPAHTRMALGERVPAGDYTLTISITDKLSLERV